MADEIVTKFTGDTSSLEAAINSAAGSLEGYDKAAADSQKSTTNLNATLGSAAGKMNTLGDAAKELAKEVVQVDNVAKRGKLKEFFLGARDGIKDALKDVGGFRGALNQLRTNVTSIGTNLKKGLGEGLKSVSGNLKNVIGQIPGIGGFLTALGPVGLAVSALGLGLFKVFTNFDEGATKLDGFRRTGGILFDQLTGAVGRLFDYLTDGQSTISRFFGLLYDGVTAVLTPFIDLARYIGDLTGLDKVAASVGDVFSSASAEGQALAKTYDDIDEAQTKNIKRNAELEKQIAVLGVQLRDRTKTDKERLAIGEQIDALEKERLDNELGVLRQITAAKRKEADLELQGKGEVSDETARALAEAQAAELRASQGSIVLTEKTQNRVNAITDAAQAKRQAAAQKAAAEQQKIAQDRLALEEELQKDILEAQSDQGKEAGQAVLTRDSRIDKAHEDADLLRQIEEAFQRDIAAIRLKYGAEQVAAQDALDAELAGRRSELAQSELDRLVEAQGRELMAVVKMGGDLNALIVQQNEERQELLNGIREAEVETLTAQFDLQYAEAEKAGLDLEALTQQQQEELAALKAKYREEDAEAQTASIEQQLEVEQKAQEDRLNLLSLQADTAANIGNLIATVAEDNTAAAQAALALQKGSAIANAIISASTARAGAIAGAASNPVIAAGGLPAIAAFAAPTIGLINANLGLTIATILAQAITGNYEGDPYVGGKPDLPTSRDMYIRRVHRGERIVTAKANAENFEALEAIESGNLDKWVADEYNFNPALNAYLKSDDGRRDVSSVMFPMGYDKNLIAASKGQHKELEGVREDLYTLTEVIRSGQRTRSRRYRN